MAMRRRARRDPEGRMSLAEHLRELRNRVVKSALAIVGGAIAGWFLFGTVYEVLIAPVNEYKAAHPERAPDIRLIYSGPVAAFSVQLSLSIFVGLIVSSPLWLYQVWAFIVPGLTKHEKRISYAFIGAAVPLFLLGLYVGHLSFPLVLDVLLSFAQPGTGYFQQLSEYFSFITRYLLGFGIAFLLPVFLVALNMIGLLPARRMLRTWRPSVFLIFVFSAIMMPTPDPYSMFILAGPLVVLFFAAIGVAALLDRRRAANRPEWLATDDSSPSRIDDLLPGPAEPPAPVEPPPPADPA